MINGVTELFMMKADVLSVFGEIKVCTQYQLKDGSLTEEMPFQLMDEAANPVYETFKGWQTDIRNAKSYEQMPTELKTYISFIEEQVGVPVSLVSVGPDRTETVLR